MNSRTPLLVASLLLSSIAAAAAAETALQAPPPPQAFERNLGQAEASAAFVSRGAGYELLVSPAGPAFSLPRADGSFASMRLRFAGARAGARLEGGGELPGIVHYLGSATGVPTYAAVTSADLYPGIGLTYRADFRALELELALAAGADPSRIRLAADASIDVEVSSGDVVLGASGARLRLGRPVATQDIDGVATEIPIELVAHDGAIELRATGADPDAPLHVRIRVTRDDAWASKDADPVRVATDRAGNVYVAGRSLAGAFVEKLRAGD